MEECWFGVSKVEGPRVCSSASQKVEGPRVCSSASHKKRCLLVRRHSGVDLFDHLRAIGIRPCGRMFCQQRVPVAIFARMRAVAIEP